MKFKISVALLALAVVAACGKDDSGLNKNKNAATTVAQADDGIHQGPVPETDGQDDPAPTPRPKKKTVKKSPVQETVKDDTPTAAVDSTPVVLAPSPSPSPTPVPQDAVVGLGTTSQKPEELMSRGYGFAIADARFCSVSGKFSGGSRCYVVYQNGKTKWADSSTHDSIEAFVVQLQAKADAEKAEKTEHKSDKKKGKFHWIKKLIP